MPYESTEDSTSSLPRSTEDRSRTCKHLILNQAAPHMAYLGMVLPKGLEPLSPGS